MTLLVQVPDTYGAECCYVASVLLGEFLGLEYQVDEVACQDLRITLKGDPTQRELILPNVLFQTPPERWLTASSLPKQPLEWWALPEALSEDRVILSRLPVIYGKVLKNGTYYSEDRGKVVLGLDIFGSTFFMLTRYEEVVDTVRDQHSRFPATASLAYAEGFLERPIINEYLEILWVCIKRLWSKLERKRREYRLFLSHDVDRPLSVVDRRWFAVLKSAAGDVLRRKDFGLAGRRIYSRVRASIGDFGPDPCNTFDFIMDTNEKYGLRSAFYFIADHSASDIEDRYSIDMPWIRSLMRRIHERGHEIGLHPSYDTYRDAAQTKRELEKLWCVVEREGISQDHWGGRQHYLRWEAPTTWQNWEDASLSYDSTLSFADHTGFRCGTCWEFPTFNLKTRNVLGLRERPLIIMEGTLLHYMDLSAEQCLDRIKALSTVCREYDGDMTLLWHNSMLLSRWQKRLYEESVAAVA